MSKMILSAFLLFAFSFPALSQETGLPDALEQVPFTTIEQRQASSFSERNLGMQTVFSDPETWKSFWESYTKGGDTSPELPYVDFDSEMIIFSSLGNISGVYMDRNKGILQVIVGDPNPSESSTQTLLSFHIIKTEKLAFKSVIFKLSDPTKDLLIGEEMLEEADTSGRQCFSNYECQYWRRQYCSKQQGACSSIGKCANRPTRCHRIRLPVCGCDGHTYGNACAAAAAGVNVRYEGSCK